MLALAEQLRDIEHLIKQRLNAEETAFKENIEPNRSHNKIVLSTEHSEIIQSSPTKVQTTQDETHHMLATLNYQRDESVHDSSQFIDQLEEEPDSLLVHGSSNHEGIMLLFSNSQKNKISHYELEY